MNTFQTLLLSLSILLTLGGLHVASQEILDDTLGMSGMSAAPVDRPFHPPATGVVAIADVAPPSERKVENVRPTSLEAAMIDLEVTQMKRNLRTGMSSRKDARERNVRYRLKTEYGIDVLD